MPDRSARAAIPPARAIDHPYNQPAGAHAAWQAHLDAGRIGNPVVPAPETVARRDAMIALFDGIRPGPAA